MSFPTFKWIFAKFKLTPLSLQHCLKRAKEEKKNNFIGGFHSLNITLTKWKKKIVN